MNNTVYYFHAAVAKQILDAMDRNKNHIDISLDLNLTQSSFSISDDLLILAPDNRLSKTELQMIAAKENKIFRQEDGRLEVLEVREEGYIKLVPTEHAPLLEISGVKMHISKGVDPYESAGQMAAQVVKKGDRVLDTCGGLGYTASVAIKLGAGQVLSIELNETVIALRKKNPWSQGIYTSTIELVHADINEYIQQLPPESFDSIIHDPPRFSLAGELYGEKFYRELFRVLKKRRALFHYTGNPHRIKQGNNFIDQAAKRLKLAGFTRVIKVSELMGLLAYK
ncbi:MAG: methyltransferase domain-containing protein [Proteobacteria bacterium]|nr:methyltransferase domain-containing protein [Pseudomonadota bacterium]MBU1688326.1 methyltransferase domain-containing protein [Pseudomonadota bacterium]